MASTSFSRGPSKPTRKTRWFSVLFDTVVYLPHVNVPAGDIEPFDSRTYRPGGGTALLDAMGTTIDRIDRLPNKPKKVVIAVVTDGDENSSTEYSEEGPEDRRRARG